MSTSAATQGEAAATDDRHGIKQLGPSTAASAGIKLTPRRSPRSLSEREDRLDGEWVAQGLRGLENVLFFPCARGFRLTLNQRVLGSIPRRGTPKKPVFPERNAQNTRESRLFSCADRKTPK